MSAPSARGLWAATGKTTKAVHERDLLTGETWLPVVGWPHFEVSDLGRMRRLAGTPKCRDGRLLNCTINDSGYLVAHLRQDGREKQMRVHLAVLNAFVGPAPSTIHEGAHEDGDRANARLFNLRWATHAENEADKVRHGTHLAGERHPSTVRNDHEAAEVLRLRAQGLSFKKIGAVVGYSTSHVQRIAVGKRRKSILETARVVL